MSEILLSIGDVIALFAMATVAVVWVIYGALFKWSKTRAGRAVYIFLSALVAVLFVSVITLWAGRVWGPNELYIREFIRIGVYLFVLISAIWMLYALVTNWRRTGKTLDLERRAVHAQAVLEQTDPNWRTRK